MLKLTGYPCADVPRRVCRRAARLHVVRAHGAIGIADEETAQ